MSSPNASEDQDGPAVSAPLDRANPPKCSLAAATQSPSRGPGWRARSPIIGNANLREMRLAGGGVATPISLELDLCPTRGASREGAV